MGRRILLLMVAALLFWPPRPAEGHTVLLRSAPAHGETVAPAPARMDVWFSQPVSASFVSLVVRDEGDGQVDKGDVRVDPQDPTRVSVSLKGSLPVGLYQATYRVTARDGHVISGVIAFTVSQGAVAATPPPAPAPAAGQPSTPEAAPQAPATPPPPPPPFPVPVGTSLIHGLVQWITVLLAGWPAFLALVWLPVAPAGPPTLRRWAAALVLALAALGLVEVSVYAVSAAGEPWSPGLLLRVLATAAFGRVWLARLGLGLLCGLGLAALSRRRSPARDALWLLPGAGLLLTLSLQSHAAATGQPAAILMDWGHLLAVAPWVGGLAGFAAGAIPGRSADPQDERASMLRAVVSRFSSIGLISVLLLTVTGIYGALLHLPALDALWTTAYGQALLTKVGLLLPVLALAGYNRFRPAGRRFQLAVGLELLLVFGIFLAAGFLTTLPPAPR